MDREQKKIKSLVLSDLFANHFSCVVSEWHYLKLNPMIHQSDQNADFHWQK